MLTPTDTQTQRISSLRTWYPRISNFRPKRISAILFRNPYFFALSLQKLITSTFQKRVKLVQVAQISTPEGCWVTPQFLWGDKGPKKFFGALHFALGRHGVMVPNFFQRNVLLLRSVQTLHLKPKEPLQKVFFKISLRGTPNLLIVQKMFSFKKSSKVALI